MASEMWVTVAGNTITAGVNAKRRLYGWARAAKFEELGKLTGTFLAPRQSWRLVERRVGVFGRFVDDSAGESVQLSSPSW